MAYSDKVLDHYENPRNVGSFAKDETDVGTGMVGAPACGDVMKLQIKVTDTGSRRSRYDLLCRMLSCSIQSANSALKSSSIALIL